MSKIEIHKNDITKLHTDAVVNAANPQLAAGTGVCGSIFEAAGKDKLEKECAKYGHCEIGAAVITSGCDMQNKYIIHAVGPKYYDGRRGESKQLYDCYQRSLELARQYDCHTIGFPLIAAGRFGYPKAEAWEIAISSCRDFIINNPGFDIDIVFVSNNREIVELGKSILADSSIDSIPIAGTKHYRVYIADMGGFRDPGKYEFVAEFASEKLAKNYMVYMRGKRRYGEKDIIIREVTRAAIDSNNEKSVIACSVLGEYLFPEEWNF